MTKNIFSLFIILAAVFSTHTISAQSTNTNDNLMNINITRSVMLPADIVIFSINMNAEGETPQDAFKLHKKREELLATLLKKYKIDSKDIKYQPIRINKRYRDDNKNLYSQTSQQVNLSFTNFDIYEQIQMTLIENGFDSFSGSFSSQKLAEGQNEALKLAIKSAREKAEFIAENSGVKLGSIKTINYSEYQSVPEYRDMSLKAMSASPSLMDIPQTVTVSAGVNITYYINGN